MEVSGKPHGMVALLTKKELPLPDEQEPDLEVMGRRISLGPV
jgi:hypothetical protein